MTDEILQLSNQLLTRQGQLTGEAAAAYVEAARELRIQNQNFVGHLRRAVETGSDHMITQELIRVVNNARLHLHALRLAYFHEAYINMAHTQAQIYQHEVDFWNNRCAEDAAAKKDVFNSLEAVRGATARRDAALSNMELYRRRMENQEQGPPEDLFQDCRPPQLIDPAATRDDMDTILQNIRDHWRRILPFENVPETPFDERLLCDPPVELNHAGD